MTPMQAYGKLKEIVGNITESHVKEAIYFSEGKIKSVCAIYCPLVSFGSFQGDTFESAFVELVYHMETMGIEKKDEPI